VVVAQNAAFNGKETGHIGKLIKNDLDILVSSYEKFNPENMEINTIKEDTSYKFLLKIYKKLKGIYTTVYYPELDALFKKINFVIQSNDIFKQAS
jgi:hypothetical protein